jgi:glucarate dehydratase
MRITELRVTPLAVPDPPLRNSWGVHEPFALRTLVELVTDEGLVGLGETYGGEAMVRALQNAARHVVGADPYQLEPLRRLINNPRVYAPIEVACLDLIGKATGRPVCDLLGGRVRDRVEFAAYLFFKYAGDDEWGEVLTPEQMVDLARTFRRRYGFRCLKVKGGVLPPEEEIRTMRLLREAFPDCRLRIDPNAVWSVETSLRVAYALRDLDLEYLEDPTSGITGMALVAQKTHIPLATNMCVTQFEHIPEAVRAGAVQVILGDHHAWGGLTAYKTLGAICETFCLGLSQHSNTHLGVSMAAMIHAGAAIPQLRYASDTHYPWQTEDIIKGGKLPIRDGYMEVPKGPGLGVDLDPDQVAKLAELYARRPQVARDDVTEMRRRDPTWLPLRPRW